MGPILVLLIPLGAWWLDDTELPKSPTMQIHLSVLLSFSAVRCLNYHV